MGCRLLPVKLRQQKSLNLLPMTQDFSPCFRCSFRCKRGWRKVPDQIVYVLDLVERIYTSSTVSLANIFEQSSNFIDNDMNGAKSFLLIRDHGPFDIGVFECGLDCVNEL